MGKLVILIVVTILSITSFAMESCSSILKLGLNNIVMNEGVYDLKINNSLQISLSQIDDPEIQASLKAMRTNKSEVLENIGESIYILRLALSKTGSKRFNPSLIENLGSDRDIRNDEIWFIDSQGISALRAFEFLLDDVVYDEDLTSLYLNNPILN